MPLGEERALRLRSSDQRQSERHMVTRLFLWCATYADSCDGGALLPLSLWSLCVPLRTGSPAEARVNRTFEV